MLSLKEIESFYPANQKIFKRNILREYLQYKMLEIIFDSKFAEKLSFIGGTAIKIIHSNNRFSEDMDFDNLGLTEEGFKQVTMLVQKKLEFEGYTVEIKNIFKGAYRCYIRIPKILYESSLSSHKEEKILIQLDTEPQGFEYLPDKVIVNKFEVFSRINVTPIDILLAQKIYAIFNRKRERGRDFYDTVFLFSKTKPNFDYLKLKLEINNMDDLKNKLLLKCSKFNFKYLAKDVEPFLITPGDSKKVLFFCDYIKNVDMK